MKLKYRLPELGGGVRVHGVDVAAKAMVNSTCYRYTTREAPLTVFDTRQISRIKPTNAVAAIDPFLKFFGEKMEPKMDVVKVWLFILGSKEDMSAATRFVALTMNNYDFEHLTYVPAKVKMFNNVNNWSVAPNVPLLLFFKKDSEFISSVQAHVEALSTST